MPVASVARPHPNPVVGSELVRKWAPETAPRAEVVLIHGIAEHSGRYEHVGSQLSGAGMAVTAPDLIGFGATGGRRGHVDDWAHYLDQVQAHIQAGRREPQPVILLGHSMGGLIALEYALSDRPSPDLLVLSAPGLFWGAAWQRKGAPIIARLTPKLPMSNHVNGEDLSRDPAVAEAYFADPLVITKSTAKLGAELFAAMDRTRAAMSSLEIPTFLVHGGVDRIVPATSTVDLGRQASVERKLYPTLRHELFNEPEGPRVIDDVVSWIDSHLR